MPRLTRLTPASASARSSGARAARSAAAASSSGSSANSAQASHESAPIASTSASAQDAHDPDDDPATIRRRLVSSRAAAAVRASGEAWQARVREREGQEEQEQLSTSAAAPVVKPIVKLEEIEEMLGTDESDRSSTPTPGAAGEETPAPRTPPPRARSKAASRAAPRATSTAQPESEADEAATLAAEAALAEAQLADEGRDPPELVRDFEWPEYYLELERVFKALNTVYAFCSARKHLATTYDTLKSSVEALLKKPLEIFDLAQLKSLCPDLISLAYVDQEALSLHLEGVAPAPARKAREAQRMELDEAYALAAKHSTAAAEPAADAELEGGLLPAADLDTPSSTSLGKRKQADEEYVLLFEFNDGTLLNGPKATARGRFGMRRGPNKAGAKPLQDLSRINPEKSAKAMKKLIDKRHHKFEQATLELLTACRHKDEDPIQLLVMAAHDHVPVHPSLTDEPTGETPRKRRIRLEALMKNPELRPSIVEVLEEMRGAPWWKEQIVPGGQRTIAAREAKHDDLTFALSQEVINALWATRKIESFYQHQADALNALDEGKNVIVSTSTSSGKSLIYQIPVLRALEEDRSSTAMFIFPTKALAQDQRRTLQDLLLNCQGLEDTIVATYDGDTDKTLRADVRDRANVIFTNPDMLHQSILPSEAAWRRFLRNLKFVVVDELHVYNGLFGAHVSFIMRRLRRICAAVGNRRVQFISCSATVANPKEHMSTLFGVDNVEVITEDGSPAGAKEWVIWNPPLIDEADPAQGRVSAYAETSRVFRHLVQRGVRTIVFTKVRRTCEIVMNQIRNDLLLDGRADVAARCMSYRSGYSPQDRRKIETDMFKGTLLGIVATSALELGIDIGTLDAVIMLGFPYSISSLRQQAGRAGRRQKDSLALLIGDPFPMDQHYMRNPDEVFSQPDAQLSVDLSNDFVREAHLQCAAAELPVHPDDDAQYFGADVGILCKTRLTADKDGYFLARAELGTYPSRDVAIRGARQETYAYIDDTPGRRGGPRVMEEVETDRAIFEAFEGAVFMHQGRSYVCNEISHDTRIARMIQSDVNYHTRPRDHTDTDAVETHRIRALRGSSSRAYYGHVRIETRVWGYFKVDKRANILDSVGVDCPPFIRNTKGLWIDVPFWLVNMLTEKTINAAAAIHAAEHALLSLTPMFVVSMAGDVRTECKIAEREYARKTTTRKRPARLIFYDTPGQNGGICAKAFEHLDGLIRIAISVIESCGCEAGCPSCVTSQTCAHANVVTSKVGSLGILRGLVGIEPFDADLPQQNEPGHAEGVLDGSASSGHTITEAAPVRTANAEVEVEMVVEELPPQLAGAVQRIKREAHEANVAASQRPAPGRSRVYEESVPPPATAP